MLFYMINEETGKTDTFFKLNYLDTFYWGKG